ncbi:hypothetical protein CXG81DRAFT_25979 [Caulochytrium protostelioides]|uniref:Extracellular membrane protein CFEM domain-containing protein n=1 Tax=Caulochytrium protostelioides TaxID=1555241 RepID=A0A4P9X8C7_9FUNG|nr:hypothetical protein CXG81DRAFT_25979 [Caulochytrium protostelioides]|eukprot:RKP01320.1 hypothetical protein CXG81DRAFT_25979 [Caulochytrium protostelioides]
MAASKLSLLALGAMALSGVQAQAAAQYNAGCPQDLVVTFNRCIEDLGINDSYPMVEALCAAPPAGMSYDTCRCQHLTRVSICFTNSCPDAQLRQTYADLQQQACVVPGVTTLELGTWVPTTTSAAAAATDTGAAATTNKATGSTAGSSADAKSGASAFGSLFEQVIMPAALSLGGLAGLIL